MTQDQAAQLLDYLHHIRIDLGVIIGVLIFWIALPLAWKRK